MLFCTFLMAGALLLPGTDSWKEALPAIGQITAGEKTSSGAIAFQLESSGVVIDPQGIVATNYHVLRNGNTTFSEVYFNLIDPSDPYQPPGRSRLYKMDILALDQVFDLALLRISADADGRPIPPSRKFKAIALGNSQNLAFLDDIYTLGFPKAGGATLTVTKGQISGKEELEGWLKIDARVTHGNSGGAVIDQKGALIGIPTKVRPDVQEVDTNGDGFPDTTVNLGTVGLIRPVEYVRALLERWRQGCSSPDACPSQPVRLSIKGMVQNAGGDSIAGALVGLLKPGSTQASVENLLTWSRADANGIFQFPIALPPGPYTFRVRAEGYEIYLQSLLLGPENTHLIIHLQPLPQTPAPSHSSGARSKEP